MKKFFIFAVVLSMLPLITINPASADSSILWSTSIGYGGRRVNTGVDVSAIPPYARLRDISFSVPKVNPDILIVGIRFDGPFDNSPMGSDKQLSANIRIYSHTKYCIYDNTCDKYVFVGAPSTWNSSYPYSPSSASVTTYFLGKGDTSGEAPKDAKCPAPWWIDNSSPQYGAIDFQLSITCLGLPSDIFAYAVAGASLSLTPNLFNYTQLDDAINPFWELAATAYVSHGGLSGVGTPYMTPPNPVIPMQPPISFIMCKKGKILRKVTGAKSLCPKGYSKQPSLATSN